MDHFFRIAFGFAAGVLAASFIPFGWPTVGFVLLVAALAYLLYRFEDAPVYLYACIMLVAACIGSGRTLLAPSALPPAFVPLIDTETTLAGIVVQDPDIRDTNQHVAIRVEEEGEETTVLAYAPLYPEIRYGEKVSVSGLFSLPEPFDTSEGRVFRYDQFLRKDGIFAVIPRAEVTTLEAPHGFVTKSISALFALKHHFADGMRAALPEPSAALAEGLLTGGKQGLGKDLIHTFTVSGLIPIVVLSGYNVMIVAEAIMKSLSFLPKNAGIAGAGVGIVLFVLMAGSGSAAVRAGAMALIALYARATGRTYDALRGLFAALILLSLWNPLYLAFDPGFQLSFIATLGLIVGTPFIEPHIKIKNAVVKDVLATTIAAQIAVLPLLLYQTGMLSLVSVFANVLVLPFIPLAMALGCIAGIVGMVMPHAAPLIGLPAHALLSYIVWVGETAAAFPLAAVSVPLFPFWITLLAYLLLCRLHHFLKTV